MRTADSTIIIITNFYLAASSHEIFLRVGGREGIIRGLGQSKCTSCRTPLAKILDPPLFTTHCSRDVDFFPAIPCPHTFPLSLNLTFRIRLAGPDSECKLKWSRAERWPPMIIFKIYFRLGNRGWWWFSFSYIVGLCYAWLVPKISLAGRPALYKVRCSSEIWFLHVPVAEVSQKRAWLRRFATAKLIVARFRCHSADLKMPTAHVIILGLAFVASSCTGNTWNFWPFAFVNAYIHRVPKWLRSTRIRP